MSVGAVDARAHRSRRHRGPVHQPSVAATVSAPPPAARHAVAPAAALSEEIRDSLRLLGGCVGATVAVAILLHLLAVWAG